MTNPHYTLEEQETVIRFDRTDAPAMLYTAAAAQAAQWRRLGIDVVPVHGHGWSATIPKAAVKIRRLVNGSIAKRKVSAAFLAAGRGKKQP